MNSECIVTLISLKSCGTNDIGELLTEEVKRKVFAVKKSVSQSEFFQAAAAGFKPDIVLEISEFEYNGENYCEIAGQRYKIYRTFSSKDTERMELYLTAVVGETNVTPESS